MLMRGFILTVFRDHILFNTECLPLCTFPDHQVFNTISDTEKICLFCETYTILRVIGKTLAKS